MLLIIIIISIFVLYHCLNKKEHFNNNLLLDDFDAYLYINLENRPDRKKQILNEFDKMKLDPEKIFRIEAVYNKWNGHIGCAKSHIKALEFAIKNKFNKIIIFEDDFIFTKNKYKINNYLQSMDKKWDVIQLTASYKQLVEDFSIKKIKWAMTSSGYMIKSHFYEKLLNNLKKSVSAMENEMLYHDYSKGKKFETSNALDQFWSVLQKSSNWYIFDPYIGTQGGEAGRSSIMSN